MARQKREEGQISKSDAIRAAIAAGIEKPSEGVSYVKKQYGLDITNQAFSTVKFQDKQKKGGRKAASGSGIHGVRAATRSGGGVGNGNGRAAELARAVKQLIERYGVEEVKGMVGVFAE